MPEPIVTRIPRDAMSDSLKPLWDMGMSRTGDATIIEVMANAPEILRWYFDEFYGGLFYNKNPAMTLDVRTKELLRLKLSKQHGCQFCNRSNTVDGLAAGLTQAQIDGLLNPTSDLFDEKDMAVIAVCEEMMLQNMHGQFTEELYARLKPYYDDKQIIEMGFIAAVLTGVAKWIFTFDMVNREETCPITPRLAAE
jgi:AhpD family alkylhydroperoxidase